MIHPRYRTRQFVLVLLVIALVGCDSSSETSDGDTVPVVRSSMDGPGRTHVGRAVCAECHADAVAQFVGSDHDLAMQEPTPENVSAPFGGETFAKDGETFAFVQTDAGYQVCVTAAASSADTDTTEVTRPVRYVFGHDPLEQYLVDAGQGRLQCVPIAWDTRSPDAGGERWFSLYPHETIPPGDELHWLGPQQNWNYMCADCHSTGVRKNYIAAEDRFDTQYAEIDVSCEACHGPGSQHVAWARQETPNRPDKGLPVDLRDRGAWAFTAGKPTAERTEPLREPSEVELCGRCHSRRSTVHESPPHGQPLADTHRVALLDPPLYFADGQIEDEVFVYGSFLQSKMHAAGVRCSDCHDPHTAKVYTTSNDLCAKCHDKNVFDTPKHHHHPKGSAGASCVDCHMPERTYMVVDPRRDHSMRIPRPDLSVSLGTPNSCNGCHADQTAEWASAAVQEWYGGRTEQRPHFAAALHAGERRSDGYEEQLRALMLDETASAIARATAITLAPRPYPALLASAIGGLSGHDSPLVRRAVAEGLTGFDGPTALRLGQGLLVDPVRTVRLAAAVSLAGVPEASASPEFTLALSRAVEEVRASYRLHLDRVETCHNFGNLEFALGRVGEAQRLFRRALSIEPTFVAARVNLADTLRAQNDNASAARELQRALESAPDHPDVHYALGLGLVRTGDMVTALTHLERAAMARPGEPRFAFVHAVALHDSGDVEGAIRALLRAAERHPKNPSIVDTLVRYLTEVGRVDEARQWSASLGQPR